MTNSSKIPVVYMDETGNKESDQFFVVGFLRVKDSEQLNLELGRIKDQIEARSRYKKQERIKRVYQENDLKQLYNFAISPNSFELKYKHISNENLSFFKILIKILINRVDFGFDAIVIDRKDPSYIHKSLTEMYKIICHMYFNFRCKEDCIFVPDSFDNKWNWREVLNNSPIKAIIPGSSHALLHLQVVDILSGIIAQGLKDVSSYNKKDIVRAPLLKVFQEEAGIKIGYTVTVNKPKYISVWTIDFSKTKKGAQGMDKKPNLGS